jgi:diacylglycerol kinase family enzyme
VSNNPYETGDIAGLGRRARLDQGVLGVVGVKIETAAQAAGLLRKAQRSRCVTLLTARKVVIDADQPQIPVGICGGSVLMPTPVRCTIHPLSLRVRVPRNRPGVPEPRRTQHVQGELVIPDRREPPKSTRPSPLGRCTRPSPPVPR